MTTGGRTDQPQWTGPARAADYLNVASFNNSAARETITFFVKRLPFAITIEALQKVQLLGCENLNQREDRHRTENGKLQPREAISGTVNQAIGKNLILTFYGRFHIQSGATARCEGGMKRFNGFKPNGKHVLDATTTALERMEGYCSAHPGSPSAARRPQLQYRGQLWIALMGPTVEEGIVGIGPTVEAALRAFDAQYLAGLRPPSQGFRRGIYNSQLPAA